MTKPNVAVHLGSEPRGDSDKGPVTGPGVSQDGWCWWIDGGQQADELWLLKVKLVDLNGQPST